MSSIRFTSFPQTQPPPPFTEALIGVFKKHESVVSSIALEKGLTSDGVLALLRPDLIALGFAVESGKTTAGKIKRPVFFGENGTPALQYEVDAFHEKWRCGLEVEAGRAWMGNAVYRDLIQAMVMVQLDYLCLAVPNTYRYFTKGRTTISRDYENAVAVASALYGHARIAMPYNLIIVGY